MKTLELETATGSLAEYAKDLTDEPVVLTVNGKPVAALVSVDNVDWETVILSSNPTFMGLIERSRRRQALEEGISSEEMRSKLGLKP